MSHYNQNRNFASHYQGQQDPRNGNKKQDDSAAVNKNFTTNISSSMSLGLSSIREKCQRLLEKQQQSNNSSGNTKTVAVEMKLLSQMSAKAVAMKAAVNQGKARILKAQPYRAGIGSETLTAQERDSQLQSENDKKQQDVLRNTTNVGGNGDDAASATATQQLLADTDNVVSGELKRQIVTKNIQSITKDSAERKILSRVVPRAFMKSVGDSIESGQIRQRDEIEEVNQPQQEQKEQQQQEGSSETEGKEKVGGQKPPNSAASPAVQNSIVVKGGGTAVVGTKKLAVDPRMAMMNSLGANKKRK